MSETRWRCWCGAEAAVLYVLADDPETVERAPGAVVPTQLGLCAAHAAEHEARWRATR